ncbi:MAG: BON domain-containing protein [Rickettsia sp.]|nr:BON domain-containing protein [Rickettsia sp.]
MLKFFVIILCILCSSCTTLIIGSSTSGVFLTNFFLSKDTNKFQILSDSTLSNNINLKLLSKDREIFHKISIHVFENKVLCIGELNSKKKKTQTLDIIKSIKGVESIFDEIKIVKNYQYSFAQIVKDSNITFFIKIRSMLHKDSIAFSNYNVITFKGIVYLLGIAKSQSEMSKITHLASNTKYVKEVRNYVKIKTKNS